MRDDESDEESLYQSIINDFPFRRQNDQAEKLAEYIIEAPGSNKIEIQEKTGISQPTIREIQKEYSELETEEKILLVMRSMKILEEKMD